MDRKRHQLDYEPPPVKPARSLMSMNVWDCLAAIPALLLLLNQFIDVRPYPNMRRDYWLANALWALLLAACLLTSWWTTTGRRTRRVKRPDDFTGGPH